MLTVREVIQILEKHHPDEVVFFRTTHGRFHEILKFNDAYSQNCDACVFDTDWAERLTFEGEERPKIHGVGRPRKIRNV